MKTIGYWLVIVGCCAGFMTCSSNEEPEKQGDRLLATVYNRTLYQSELEGLIGTGLSPADSIQRTNAYINRWVKESLLMHEAEKHVPKSLNIDELVRDYRASLIRHSYEKLLVDSQLDSLVTDTEANEYYIAHREDYRTNGPLLRCYYAKIPKDVEGWSEFKNAWRNKDKEDEFMQIVDYCSRNAALYMLEDSTWYSLEEIQNQLPKNTLTTGNYLFRKDIDTSDDNFQYLVWIKETVAAKEYAPIGFVRDQINKVILHKRKIKLLDDKKDKIYEKESRLSNIKVYTE